MATINGYSSGRVLRLAVKHYTEHRSAYMLLYGMMIFVPLLFAMLARNASVAASMSMAVYLCGAFVVPFVTMKELRAGDTKIMANTLPVSAAERMTFVALNTSIVYTLLETLCAGIAVAVAACVDSRGELIPDLSHLWHTYNGHWEIMILVWIVSSSNVVVNTLARKRIVAAYVCAFVAVMLAIWGLARMAESGMLIRIEWSERLDTIAKTIYCITPAVLYGISYLLLRRRQVKW